MIAEREMFCVGGGMMTMTIFLFEWQFEEVPWMNI